MAHCAKDTQVVAPLLKNDHCTIGITLNFHITRQQCYTRLMWDYARGDFDGLRNHLLNVEWDDVCNNYIDVEIAAEQWTKTVLEALKAFIPNKLVTVRTNDKPWYNGSLRRLKRKVNRIHKRAKISNVNQAWANYRKIRNEYIHKCRESESKYENDQLLKLSNCSFTTKLDSLHICFREEC